jgi:tetratricopeptide (TPR) repeat protein
MTDPGTPLGPQDTPQSGEEIGSVAAPAPSSARAHSVPGLGDFQWPPPKDWQKFERLCHALWRRIWGDIYAQMNGRPGQKQDGVDVFGTPKGGTRVHGVQCKRKDVLLQTALTEAEMLVEVENAKAFQPPLAELVIATCAPSDASLQRLARKISDEHATQGLFRVSVLGWSEIEARMAEHPDVVAQVYPTLTTPRESTPAERSDAQQAELLAGHLAIRQGIAQLASQLAVPTEGPAHAKLDACRELLEAQAYRSALQLLDRIRDKEWDTASASVRFRIATNLAAAHLGLEESAVAGEWFVKAFEFDQATDKALANYALGLFLLDRPTEALAAARKAIEKHPLSARSWSAYINVAGRVDSETEIPEIPASTSDDPDVLFAYGDALAMRSRLPEAERTFRKLIALPKFHVMAKARLAETILTQVTGGRMYGGVSFSPGDATRLREARSLLEETWNSLKRTDGASGAVHVIQNFSAVCALLGQMQQAETAIDEGLAVVPGASGLLVWKIRTAVARGDSATAIRVLAKLSPNSVDEYPIVAATVHRAAHDVSRAAKVLEDYIQASSDPSLSNDARCMFAGFVCESDLAHAEARFNALPNATSAQFALSTVIFARALREAGSPEGGERYLALAREPLASSTSARDRLILADALAEFGQHEAAVAIYERDVATATDTPSLREYIRSLFELDQRRRLTNLLAALPNEGFSSGYYEYARANLLIRSGDFPGARSALERSLLVEPNQLSTRLLWAQVSIHLNDLRPAQDWLDTIDVRAPDLTLDQLLHLGPLYHALGSSEMAAAVFYEALRRFPHDPRTHLAFSASVLFKGSPAWAPDACSVVGRDMAVRLRDTDGRERTYILENRLTSELRPEEISDSSELGTRLMGRKVGDTVIGHSSELAVHESTVIGIEHKYVHAWRDSTGAFNTRFPDHPGLIGIKLPLSGPPEERLAPILRAVKEKSAHGKQVEATIRQGMPLAAVGSLLGRTSIEAWRGLVGRRGEPLPVCLGNVDERQNALNLIQSGRRFLVDPIGLMELHLMHSLGVVEATLGRLGVVQATLDELRQMSADLGLHTDGYMTVFEKDGQYYRQEVPARAVEEDRRQIHSLLDWVQAHCEVVIAVPPLDPRPEAAAALDRALGHAVYDTLLAAQGGNFVLLSDDFNLRRLAKEEFGLDGVWIQPILMYAADKKRMKQDHYNRSVVSLAQWGHDFTSVTAQQLLFTVNRGGWRVTPEFEALVATMPLIRSDLRSSLQVSISFLKELWKKGRGPTRSQATKLTHALLKAVNPNASENGERYLRTLQAAAAQGHLPARAGQAIESWHQAP